MARFNWLSISAMSVKLRLWLVFRSVNFGRREMGLSRVGKLPMSLVS